MKATGRTIKLMVRDGLFILMEVCSSESGSKTWLTALENITISMALTIKEIGI
jgi:hypothetical protein